MERVTEGQVKVGEGRGGCVKVCRGWRGEGGGGSPGRSVHTVLKLCQARV